ncbi:MAG: zinc-ribbon domain-containing protein [Egibacteraceae bacterium]
MRTFCCPRCRQRVFFENASCLSCGLAAGFRARGG